MDYPPDFPNRLKPAVAAALARAQRKFPNQDQRNERVKDAFFAFTEIACKAVENGEWRVDLALSGSESFLHALSIYHPAEPIPPATKVSGLKLPESPYRFIAMRGEDLEREIKASEQWLRHLERLTELAESQTEPSDIDPPKTRKDLVLPILEEKGWSLEDWANEAGVAYHTVADYLSGKSNPFTSTRAKLAKSLGLPVNSLPK